MGERARKRSSKWDLNLKEESHLSHDHTRTSSREFDKMSTWDDDRGSGTSTRMSPGLNDWRKQRVRSPRDDRWDRSARKRSRTRSRSRSPIRTFRQEPGNYDRNRSRSAAPCKDFTAGRCRRGDDCSFLHQGSRDYDEGGTQKGETSRYSNTYNDSREYPVRPVNDHDRRSSICKFFAAGNCRNGKFCRFSHSIASESPNRRLELEKPVLSHNPDRSSKNWEDPRFGGTDASRFDDGDGRKGGRWEPRSTERVLGDSEMSPDWYYRVNSSNQVRNELNETRLEPPGFSQNFSVNFLHGQNIEHKHHGLHTMPPPNIKPVGQHDVVLREGSPMSPFAERKPGFDAWQPNTSQINRISPNKNSMTNEQLSVTQLTNISASLAQLLGAGKQLPELYAALSAPADGPPLVPSNMSVPQKLYDPLCDGIESKKSINADHQLGVSSVSIANGEKEVQPSNGNSEPHISTNQANQLEPCGSSDDDTEDSKEDKTVKQKDEERKNGRTGEKKDEEKKKSKEGKALRAFKFALAENVKELLKPSWKEGLVAKDAYKTIVKKVVDKVTGSLQGPSIPQNQEKVDSYLKLSKPKLTKLVQAYVDKFQKSK